MGRVQFLSIFLGVTTVPFGCKLIGRSLAAELVEESLHFRLPSLELGSCS